MIIHSSLYKGVVFALLALAPAFLFGIHKSLARLPSRIDALVAIVLLGAAWILINKRQKYFPRVAQFFKWAIGILALLSLLLGANAQSVLVGIRETVEELVSNIVEP